MSDYPGLLEILQAQCDVHLKQLAIEEEKTRVLLEGDAKDLLPLLNDQQALLMQSRELEKQRCVICSGTAYPTLRELVDSSVEHKARFGTVFETLSAAVMALKKKCGQNKKLLETRAATIRFLLGQSGQEAGANTYTKNVQAKG